MWEADSWRKVERMERRKGEWEEIREGRNDLVRRTEEERRYGGME